jgi:polyisoprenoid-binding protein YceI
MPRPRHPVRWIAGAIVVIAALAVGGPFVYIHFLSGSTPAALTLPTGSPGSPGSPGTATATPAATGSTGTTTTDTSIAGSWHATAGSVVGYRVNEVLLGQNATAVGRSTQVTGHLTVTGSTVSAASFSVPMSTIHSDKSQRDAQFDGRIMNVSQYPAGTFTLTQPVDLSPVPAANTVKDYTAHGNLTLHGTTRSVTLTLQAELKNGQIDVTGQIPVLFADYNIANPSFAGFVTTQDHGILEFLLVFSKG